MHPDEEFPVVKNLFNLQTFQRRLRHLQSIAVRNLHCPRNQEIDISKVAVYFTLHKDEKRAAFYTSEKVTGSLNPTWQSFLLPRGDADVDLTSKFVVVRVWCSYGKKPKVKIEAHVYLSGLVYFANRLQVPGIKHQQNTLLFGMFNHFFIHYNACLASSHLSQWIADPEVPRNSLPAMVKVDPVQLRVTYNTNYLSRIHTVQRAICQTQVSVQKIHSSIEDRLLASTENSEKLSQREVLLMKVRQLRQELLWQTQQKQIEEEGLEKYRSEQDSRLTNLKERRLQLQNLTKETEEKRLMHIQSREMLVKENAQVLFRRKQIISEMVHYVYPITEDEKHNFYICNVRLPNAEDYQGQEETKLSVALGFTCHLTQMVSHFMDMPLRYPMVHKGSRSNIIDHIHSKMAEKDREFPLYGKGKEKFQYNYAVFLLNKNISQLRFYCGLGTNDLRQTLPNLKTLFEQRLGVRSTSTSEQQGPTSLQSPPPTSLGGSQTSKRSQAASSAASSYNRREFSADQDAASQPLLRSASANSPLVEGISTSNQDIHVSAGIDSGFSQSGSVSQSTSASFKRFPSDIENFSYSSQRSSGASYDHARNGNGFPEYVQQSSVNDSENLSGHVQLRKDSGHTNDAIAEEDETEDIFKPSDDNFFKAQNPPSVSAFNLLLRDSQNDSDTLPSSFSKDIPTNGIIPNSDIFLDNTQRSFKMVKSSALGEAASSTLTEPTGNMNESWTAGSPNSPAGFQADLVSWGSGPETQSQNNTVNHDQDTDSYCQSSSYNDSEIDASGEKNGTSQNLEP